MFSAWWRKRTRFRLAVTAWTVAVVAAVLVGMIGVESGPDSEIISNDQFAAIIVCLGFLVWFAGFLLISLGAWLIDCLRLHRSVEKGSNPRGIAHQASSSRRRDKRRALASFTRSGRKIGTPVD